MLRSGKVLMAIAVAFGLLAMSALAQAPPTLMYQGKLTDANLDPITTATEVTFKIWDAQDETGVELWAEVQSVTPNAQGVFTVELGAITPFPPGLFDGSVRFLGMTVTGDDEMLPRQPITSTPYSLQSNTPGIAHSYRSSASLSTTTQGVDTLTVTVPGPGYLVLEATCWGEIYANTTSSQYIIMSISDDASTLYYPASTIHYRHIYYTNTTVYQSMSVMRLEPVVAGTYTFYLTAFKYYSGSSAWMDYINFKAEYVPTWIGSEAPPVPPAPAATPGDEEVKARLLQQMSSESDQ